MTTLEQALASTLRSLREQKGISQIEVSNLTGYTQASISRYESGSMSPSIEHLSLLASSYETTPSEIFNIAESNNIIDLPKKGKNAYSNKNKSKKKHNKENS